MLLVCYLRCRKHLYVACLLSTLLEAHKCCLFTIYVAGSTCMLLVYYSHYWKHMYDACLLVTLEETLACQSMINHIARVCLTVQDYSHYKKHHSLSYSSFTLHKTPVYRLKLFTLPKEHKIVTMEIWNIHKNNTNKVKQRKGQNGSDIIIIIIIMVIFKCYFSGELIALT